MSNPRVRIPAVWSELLVCKLGESARRLPIHTRVPLDDPQRYYNDKRSIPVILDNFYSAEIILWSDDESYYGVAMLKIGGKVIKEEIIWNRLDSIVIHDRNDVYFTIDLVWEGIGK